MRIKLMILGLVCCSMVAFATKHKKSQQRSTQNTNTPKDTVDYKTPGAPMPPLRVTTMKGKTVTDKDLKNNATLLVMMFNPNCEHCENQTELFKQNIWMFKNTKLVLMAGSMMLPYLEGFENSHNVSKYSAMIMGVDSSDFINRTFIYNALPQINIYNADRKLERVFTGNVPMDSLKAYIQ